MVSDQFILRFAMFPCLAPGIIDVIDHFINPSFFAAILTMVIDLLSRQFWQGVVIKMFILTKDGKGKGI